MFQPAGTINRILQFTLSAGDDSSLPQHVHEDHSVQLRKKFAEEFACATTPRVISLGNSELLVRTLRDFYLVVPGWNIDVAPGIVRDGFIEPWTNEVFLSLLGEGEGIINVGANFGYYSVLGAQKVGRTGQVYAIEANPAVFPYLVKSAYWAGYPDVIRCFNCAAASPEMDNQAIDFLFDPQFIGGGNMFNRNPAKLFSLQDALWSQSNMELTLNRDRQFVGGGVYSRAQAVCRTVDRIVPADARIHAMIIDAEGSECFVIAGARETIRRNPDMSLIVEWASCNIASDPARKPAIDAMWNFLLDEMRYRVFRICPEGYEGIGSMPRLEAVHSREELYNLPHSDMLLTR